MKKSIFYYNFIIIRLYMYIYIVYFYIASTATKAINNESDETDMYQSEKHASQKPENEIRIYSTTSGSSSGMYEQG